MLSSLPVETLLGIIQYLPPAAIASLSVLSKSWAALMDANESPIYHNISKRHGYAPKGDPDVIAPSEGWKTWFIRKFQIDLRWIGKLPGNLYRVKVPEGLAYFHRVKVDEEAGYVINTFISGGLVVSDIHDLRVLWALDEDFCESFAHCEYDEGFLVFNRFNVYKEVWRRRVDVLDIPKETWPSTSQNKPDQSMIEGQRIADERFLDASRSGDPDHLRGQFVPWARLTVPADARALKLTRGTLLVSNSQNAFLFDVEKAELRQTIAVDALAGFLRYVDISDKHAFIVSTHSLHVYDRSTGSPVLCIRQPWDFYATPENQLRRTEESFNHGELGFRWTGPSGSDYKDDYFHAVHVSSCGKHLAVMTMSSMVILVQDFWRLLPNLPDSPPETPGPPPITLKDISKQVDFYTKHPSPQSEGYLAYNNGKVAVMGKHGVYVLVLDSVLDELGEINSLPKDVSLQAMQPTSPKHEESWPSLRLREVEFRDLDMSTTTSFSCLQLSETKLYFTVLPNDDVDDGGGNMWCYDFASSPSSTTPGPTAERYRERDWDSEGNSSTEQDWDDEDDWDEVEARLAGGLRRSGRN